MSVDFGDLILEPCIQIFGEPVLYQPADGEPFTLNGIFDQAYRPLDAFVIEGIKPMHVTVERSVLGVRLADLPLFPRQGDLLSVRGLQYYVQEVQSDGKGGAKLLLNKQSGQR